MNILATLLKAAEETTAAVTIDPIVTEFSDLKMPVMSMIMMGLAAVVTLAVLIAGIYLLFDRTDNWGMALIAGLAAYMIFCYLLYMGIQIGLNALPFTQGFVQQNPKQMTIIMTILSGILASLAVYLALKYVSSQAMKRGQSMTIGTPLGVGIGMFAAAVLTNREIMTNLQYIMMSVSINKMGFDEAVTTTVQSMVENGYTLEEATKTATESLHSMMTEPSISFFLNSFYYILIGVLETMAAILVYGAMTEKLEEKWMFVGFGGLMLSIVPSILVSVTSFPSWAGVLVNCVITAAVAVITIKLAKQYMPEELHTLTYSHRRNRRDKGDGEKKKMPHIVMPDK